MFSGRVTKPFGYFVSFANGFDTVSLLDVFVDLDYDPRLRLRIGRFKTPFTYEFLVEPIQGLVTPERSIFFNNFGQNRDVGVMAFGRLFDNTFDYAGGHLQRQPQRLRRHRGRQGRLRRSSTGRPFGNEEGSLLENFNIGGSVFAGDSRPGRRSRRPSGPSCRPRATPSLGVPFLALNNNVREYGLHGLLGPARRLVLPAAGRHRRVGQRLPGLRPPATASPDQAPGRELLRPGQLPAHRRDAEQHRHRQADQPVRPPQGHSCGTGAIEPFFRYEYLDIGNQVFTAGLADPNLWANRALPDRPRRQLAPDPVRQDLLRLEPRRVQPAGPLRPGPAAVDQRHVHASGSSSTSDRIGSDRDRPGRSPRPAVVNRAGFSVADLEIGPPRLRLRLWVSST